MNRPVAFHLRLLVVLHQLQYQPTRSLTLRQTLQRPQRRGEGDHSEGGNRRGEHGRGDVKTEAGERRSDAGNAVQGSSVRRGKSRSGAVLREEPHRCCLSGVGPCRCRWGGRYEGNGGGRGRQRRGEEQFRDHHPGRKLQRTIGTRKRRVEGKERSGRTPPCERTEDGGRAWEEGEEEETEGEGSTGGGQQRENPTLHRPNSITSSLWSYQREWQSLTHYNGLQSGGGGWKVHRTDGTVGRRKERQMAELFKTERPLDGVVTGSELREAERTTALSHSEGGKDRPTGQDQQNNPPSPHPTSH